MATTKVRAKTPMANKTKDWRKQSRVTDPETGKLRRIGRMYKNIRSNMGEIKAYPTEMILLLMKHAGVETPVFDAKLEAVRQHAAQLKAEREAEVQDVEPVAQPV